MTLSDVWLEARSLTTDERKTLIKMLVDTLDDQIDQPVRGLLEFRGVGARLRDMDAQEYVNQLRSEWDDRP